MIHVQKPLGLIEKILLQLRGKRDGKKNRFEKISESESVSHSHFMRYEIQKYELELRNQKSRLEADMAIPIKNIKMAIESLSQSALDYEQKLSEIERRINYLTQNCTLTDKKIEIELLDLTARQEKIKQAMKAKEGDVANNCHGHVLNLERNVNYYDLIAESRLQRYYMRIDYYYSFARLYKTKLPKLIDKKELCQKLGAIDVFKKERELIKEAQVKFNFESTSSKNDNSEDDNDYDDSGNVS